MALEANGGGANPPSPRTSHGLARTSEHRRVLAGPTIPSPVDLRSKVLSPSTVWLEWKDPAVHGRVVVQQSTDADSRYYNVHYRPLMAAPAAAVSGGGADRQAPVTAAGGRTLSVVVKTGHVVFYDLRPGTRYEFKVRSVKDAVASAFSETVVNKTFETGAVLPVHHSFLARDIMCTSRAYATMSVSVCLSVTDVHWRIIANLGFKFRSQFTAHCGRGACGREGRDHRREEWRDRLELC